MTRRKATKRKTIEAIPPMDEQKAEVNQFTRAHGDYVTCDVVDLTGELGGKRNAIVKVVKNRGGTTIERWQSNGSLDQTQAQAITMFCAAWRRHIGEQRVSMNWSLTSSIRGVPVGDVIDSAIEAKRLLEDMDKLIFSRMPRKYYDVWLNVTIFDQAAGVAGETLGFKSERAEAAAKAVVLMVADMISWNYRL